MSDDLPVAEAGVVKVSVRERGGAIVEAVRLLGEARVGVDDVTLRRPTLDDVFLALTGHAAEDASDGGAPDGDPDGGAPDGGAPDGGDSDRTVSRDRRRERAV
jgi:hypothetical protein